VFLSDLMGGRNMCALTRLLVAFSWVGLVACGGGNEEPVVYRDDNILVVDGREYSRRTEGEIKNEFGESVSYTLLDLLGKPGVKKIEVESQLNKHGLFTYHLDCEFWADENRCGVLQIAVPPEWSDQWRRAMADWDWVERDSVRFEGISFSDT
jgi:hypothetical protein